VLVSGYYYPSTRLDAALVTPGAVPVLGDLLNHTVSPPLMHMTLPGTLRTMFAPRRVPDRFRDVFPEALIPRPKQIRAMSQEGAIMVPAAAALRPHYGGVSCPSIVMTGDADRVVDPEDQSIRLAHELNDAELRIVRGAGHMVHHADPLFLAQAINRVASGHAVSGVTC
jgi:pimeloyl-ACP methyl ester carboxylesterase